MEILPFLIWPFVASLILTGIHAYLGVHVVERGVIFVDLALAQIAALGATFAILVGMDPHGRGAYFLSLGFTFLGAAIFALARSRRGHIPQEAFIGIAYAVASAAAILAMSKATGETEHLKDMLVGNILSFDVAVVYEKPVDIKAEHERLSKELAKLAKEKENSDRQLANESFLAKAPASVVEGIRRRNAELTTLIERTSSALASLPSD